MPVYNYSSRKGTTRIRYFTPAQLLQMEYTARKGADYLRAKNSQFTIESELECLPSYTLKTVFGEISASAVSIHATWIYDGMFPTELESLARKAQLGGQDFASILATARSKCAGLVDVEVAYYEAYNVISGRTILTYPVTATALKYYT